MNPSGFRKMGLPARDVRPSGAILWCATIVLGLLLCGGCMGTYGRPASHPDVMAQYRDRRLDSDRQYYYCGRSGLPYAVIGLDKSVSFNDRFWFPIQTLDAVYDKIDHLSTLHPFATSMTAAQILTPDNDTIGVWFSYYHHTPVQVDPDTGKVTIFNPYDPNEDDWGDMSRINAVEVITWNNGSRGFFR